MFFVYYFRYKDTNPFHFHQMICVKVTHCFSFLTCFDTNMLNNEAF